MPRTTHGCGPRPPTGRAWLLHRARRADPRYRVAAPCRPRAPARRRAQAPSSSSRSRRAQHRARTRHLVGVQPDPVPPSLRRVADLVVAEAWPWRSARAPRAGAARMQGVATLPWRWRPMQAVPLQASECLLGRPTLGRVSGAASCAQGLAHAPCWLMAGGGRFYEGLHAFRPDPGSTQGFGRHPSPARPNAPSLSPSSTSACCQPHPTPSRRARRSFRHRSEPATSRCTGPSCPCR